MLKHQIQQEERGSPKSVNPRRIKPGDILMPFLLRPTHASTFTARSHEITRKQIQLLPRLCCTLRRFLAVLLEESLRPFDAPAQNRCAVDPVNNP